MAFVENEFTDIESTEHILRTIDAREGKTRHSFQGIGHTAYLCFARKAFFDRGSKKKPKPKSNTEEKKTSKKTTKKASSKTKKSKPSLKSK